MEVYVQFLIIPFVHLTNKLQYFTTSPHIQSVVIFLVGNVHKLLKQLLV